MFVLGVGEIVWPVVCAGGGEVSLDDDGEGGAVLTLTEAFNAPSRPFQPIFTALGRGRRQRWRSES